VTDQLGIAEDLREARERIQRQEESIAELRRERDEARARVRELEETRLSDAEGHAFRMDVAIAQHEELRNMYDEQRQRAEAAGAQLAALREPGRAGQGGREGRWDVSRPRLLAHERDAAIARAEAAEARVKDAEAHLDDAAHLIASVWDVVGRAEELTTPADGARVLLTRAETAEARVRELTRERDEALKALETTTVAVALANRVGMSDHAAAQHHWLEAHKATERAEAAEARVRELEAEVASYKEDEEIATQRAVRDRADIDKVRADTTLSDVERTRRVLQTRCDQYEYVPNYLAAVADIEAFERAVREEASQRAEAAGAQLAALREAVRDAMLASWPESQAGWEPGRTVGPGVVVDAATFDALVRAYDSTDTAERQQALESHRIALRNVLAHASRLQRRGVLSKEDAGHFIRFCKSAGIEPSIIRVDAEGE